MIAVLQRLEELTSWDEKRGELGRYLGASGPVPEGAFRRARADDRFASLLVLSRHQPDLLNRLFSAHANRAYAQRAVSPPTTLGALRKAAGSLIEWARSGFEEVGAEVFAARTVICGACPHLVAPPELLIYKLKLSTEKDMRVCDLCGCVARRKARLATERCPDGRWQTATGNT